MQRPLVAAQQPPACEQHCVPLLLRPVPGLKSLLKITFLHFQFSKYVLFLNIITHCAFKLQIFHFLEQNSYFKLFLMCNTLNLIMRLTNFQGQVRVFFPGRHVEIYLRMSGSPHNYLQFPIAGRNWSWLPAGGWLPWRPVVTRSGIPQLVAAEQQGWGH